MSMQVSSNLVGSIGDGDGLYMFDQEHYGYVTGNIITVHHVSRGPKDFLTMVNGISTITTHQKTQVIAIAPLLVINEIEIMHFPTQTIKSYLSNSTNVKMISLSFSYDGDRLIGLSDVSNSTVIGWNITTSSVLFTTKIDHISLVNYSMNTIYCNTCDADSFSLSGSGHILYGKIDETLNVYSVEFYKMTEDPIQLPLLQFLIWLPSNLALLYDIQTGQLFTYNIIDKVYSELGHIYSPHDPKEIFYPTCAIMTLDSLVLGSKRGELIWINIHFTNLIKLPAGIGMNKVILIDHITQYILFNYSCCYIVPIDVEHESCIIKTSDSSYIHLPLKLMQSSVINSSDIDMDNSNDNPYQAVMLPTTITNTLLEVLSQPITTVVYGVIPIIKSDGDDAFLSCYITLCSSNEIIFWKIPNNDMVSNKKLLPETYQKIKVYNTIFENNRINEVISSMIFQSNMSTDISPVLITGSSDGYIDVYSLFVIESEEDDLGNYDEHVNGLFEDDGLLLRLDMTQSSSIRLYETPITILSYTPDNRHFAVGSFQSNELYVLSYTNDNKLLITKRLSILHENQLLSIIWSKNNTYMICILQNGKILFYHNEFPVSHSISNNSNTNNYENMILIEPYYVYDMDINLTGIYVSLLANNTILCQNSQEQDIFAIQLPNHLDTANIHNIQYTKQNTLLIHNTYIICFDISSNQKYLAIGYLDGSISIWNIIYDQNHMKYILLQMIRPHSNSIYSIKFSYDCKCIMSISCDGSYFIVRLDHNYKPNYHFNVDFSNIDISNANNKKYIRNHSIYSKLHTNYENNKLIEKYSTNVIDIENSISVLKEEIKNIINDNTMCDVSEQLSRDELVIDMQSREKVLYDINNQLLQLKYQYSNQIMINECIACRIREKCFDILDMKSVRLYPITNDTISSVTATTSTTGTTTTNNMNNNTITTGSNTTNDVSQSYTEGNTNISNNANINATINANPNGLNGSTNNKITLDDNEEYLTSFPIIKYTEEERIILDRMKRLRLIEMKSQRYHEHGHFEIRKGHVVKCTWQSSVQGCQSFTPWIDEYDVISTVLNNDNTTTANTTTANTIAGTHSNSVPVSNSNVGTNDNNTSNHKNVNANNTKLNRSNTNPSTTNNNANLANSNDLDEDDISVESDNQDLDMKSYNIYDILYSAFSIRTQIQKRTQIYFLRQIDYMIRKQYNENFILIKLEKDDIVLQINQKINRILEIQNDLGIIDNDIVLIKKNNKENDNDSIIVYDNELNSIPYESEEMKKKRILYENELKNNENKKYLQDNKLRGLMDMMNGVLEAKKRFINDNSIPTTDSTTNNSSTGNGNNILDMNINEMNETQRKEYEKYELIHKQLLEEKLKYKKSLEQENKKLKIDIYDIIKLFKEKYIILYHNKFITEKKLLMKELYNTLLANNIIYSNDNWNSLYKLKESITQYSIPINDIVKRSKALKSYLDELSNKISVSQDEEKLLDKTFKRDIQLLCNTTFDQDTLKLLLSLYRSRAYANNNHNHTLQHYGVSETEKYDHSNHHSHNHMTNGSSMGLYSRSGSGSQTGKDMSGHNSKSRTNRNHSRHRGSNAPSNNRSSYTDNNNTRAMTNTNRQSKVRASKTNNGISSNDVKDSTLGPMQEAARALKIGDTNNEEYKDIYQMSILYHIKHNKNNMIHIPIIDQLKMELEYTDGINIMKLTWAKLQELRIIRIEKEITTKKLLNEQIILKNKYDLLKELESKYDSNMNNIIVLRNNIYSKIQDNENNLDIMIKLKNGQNEVISNIMNISYNKAILLPINTIYIFNQRICDIGKDKIHILYKMKQYRRKNNYVSWETTYLDLLKYHYSEYYTDLQLLRVTKDLQQILREGSDPDTIKSKYEKYSNRKEFVNKDSKDRLHMLQKQKQTLIKRHSEKQNETIRLESHIIDLMNQVRSRKDIKQFSNYNIIKLQQYDTIQNKMKKITNRRILIDLAKTQAEEIDFLRQELDKIRQRTFPSFVKTNKNGLPYTNST